MNLHITNDDWEPVGERGSEYDVLLGPTIYIGGVGHHLNAYRVVEVDGLQEFADAMVREDLTDVFARLDSGRWEAVRLTPTGGPAGDYTLLMTPFST